MSAGAGTAGIDTSGLGTVHWVGLALAAVTGVIHLVLGVSFVPSGTGIALLLAGLGYVGAIVLVLLDVRRRLLYAVGVPYTAVQIPLWYWVNYGSTGRSLAEIGGIEVVDKVAQVALILLLVYLYRQSE